MTVPGSDRCQAVAPATSQEPDQHGFGLVVECVTGHHLDGKHGLAGQTCSRLKVWACFDRNGVQHELDIDLLSDRTSPLGFGPGFRPNLMINVMSGDGQIMGVSERNQCSGIRATGKRTVNGRASFGKGAARKKCGERTQSSRSRWRLPPGYFFDVTCLR